MKKLFLFLFLISCATPNYNVNNNDINIKSDLTFDEFDEFLTQYSKISSYPNID
jgi:hypothetical protein